jgi:hypothetical protein
MYLILWALGSHSSDYEEYFILGRDTLQYDRRWHVSEVPIASILRVEE